MHSKSQEILTNKKITTLKKEIVRLETLVYKDVLVDAYNRRGFLKFSQMPFNMAIQARNYSRRSTDKARDLCLILIDVDNFKHFNDEYSYAIGDAVLKTVAAYFNHSIRQTDVFGRWGGDEFVLLLPFTKAEIAKKLAEHHVINFAKTILEILRVNNIKVYVEKWLGGGAITFSMGIASLNKEKTIQTLLNKANKGLKLAKKQKNAIVITNK
jgi:diguanylate cyclase (GGDEF)-like protein